MARDLNPFQTSGPIKPADMIDRDVETGELFDLADGSHSSRHVTPTRDIKTLPYTPLLR